MIPKEVSAWLLQQGHGTVVSEEPVGGGCINNGARLETKNGLRFFIKTNSAAPSDMFVREAEGLEALRIAAAVRVPDVHLTGEDFILLEDLGPGSRVADYWEARSVVGLLASTTTPISNLALATTIISAVRRSRIRERSMDSNSLPSTGLDFKFAWRGTMTCLAEANCWNSTN